jgi:hypothetical protein
MLTECRKAATGFLPFTPPFVNIKRFFSWWNTERHKDRHSRIHISFEKSGMP